MSDSLVNYSELDHELAGGWDELLDDDLDVLDDAFENGPMARHTDIIWITAEGEHIPITQMETGHLFNAMKMLFNHLADVHGGRPVMFSRQRVGSYLAAHMAPKHVALLIVAMLTELDQRHDLPPQLSAPLEEIRSQIMPKRLAAAAEVETDDLGW